MAHIQLKGTSGAHSSWAAALLVTVLVFVVLSPVQSAPQLLDTYKVQKSANSTYTYESTNGLQKGYSYAFGDTYVSGYKSECTNQKEREKARPVAVAVL